MKQPWMFLVALGACGGACELPELALEMASLRAIDCGVLWPGDATEAQDACIQDAVAEGLPFVAVRAEGSRQWGWTHSGEVLWRLDTELGEDAEIRAIECVSPVYDDPSGPVVCSAENAPEDLYQVCAPAGAPAGLAFPWDAL